MPHTILLVDDQPVFRQELRLLLEKEKDLHVVGDTGDGHMAMDLIRRLTPDLVVMDISVPNLEGIDATRQILSECPETRVIALSENSDTQIVRDLIQAGASGHIHRGSRPEEMIEGIRTVLSGDVYLSKPISKILVSDYKTLVSEPGWDQDSPPVPILYTKLHRPPIATHIVPRTRLIESLESGKENPVTLVAAPAGYGKSILASQWLDASKTPGVWVSLDDGDNDLRLFLGYILEAVQSLFPLEELRSKSLLNAAELPSIPVISRYLLNDLETRSERFILVLDDFHLIQSAAIHEFIEELLVHPSSTMHLTLLTRKDPPLPLTTLRSRGMLTEITTSHLRFTVSETKSFLERFLNTAIAENIAQVLEEKMEGWVTGLHLAALSIKDEEDQERLTAGLMETPQYVQDYLFQAVLSRVQPGVRLRLLQSSILDRFCAPLCDALSEADPERNQTETDAGGRDFIDWLINTKLFVIHLDTKNQWFRYHHLFQEILQSELKKSCSAEEIRSLHARAGEWFAENGLVEAAIRHRVAAGDVNTAVQLVEQNRQTLLNGNRWYVLSKWLSMLPDTAIEQRPELLLAKNWVHYYQYRIELIPPILDAAESLLNDDPKEQSLCGEIYLFKGVVCFWQGDGAQSLEYIEEALVRIPVASAMFRGFAEIYLGLAGQMQGQNERVVRILSDLLNDQPMEYARRVRLQTGLVWIHLLSGDLAAASMLNRQLRDEATQHHAAAFIAASSYNQGRIHFQRNEHDAAIHYLSHAAEMQYLMLRRADIDCMAGLALAYQAAQQTGNADATLTRLFEFIRSFNDPALLDIAYSCRAHVLLMRGDAVSDYRLPGIHGETNMPVLSMSLEIPVITQCRLLLANGANADLRKAEKTLRECLRLNKSHHNSFQMIGILALLTLVIDRQGRLEESLAVLKQAVVMAEPGGFIRPFIELGRPMADLLKQLIKKNTAMDFAGKLLAAFGDDEPVSVQNDPVASPSGPSRRPPHPPRSPSHQPQPLVEPLTNRELDVLELLAQRLQSKEIAEALSISPATVKSHLRNIYQKLDAANRREAVQKAKNLDLL